MKIWNFEGNGENYISDVSKILKKYSDGFNESQKALTARIDARVNDKSEAVFSLNLDNGFNLITCTVKFDGYVKLEINYYRDKIKETLKIGEIETLLDEVIKSDKMASLISHLIYIKKSADRIARHEGTRTNRNYWI